MNCLITDTKLRKRVYNFRAKESCLFNLKRNYIAIIKVNPSLRYIPDVKSGDAATIRAKNLKLCK